LKAGLISTGLKEDWLKLVGKLQLNQSQLVIYGLVWLPENWAAVAVAPDEGPKTGLDWTFKH